MSIELSPSLQSVVRQVTVQSLEIPAHLTSGEAHRHLGSLELPPIEQRDFERFATGLLAALGKARLEDLAELTQDHCFACGKDPREGLVLWAQVLAAQVFVSRGHCHRACQLPPRTEPLPQLAVEAIMGRYEDPARRRDPLILVFRNVEPSTPEHPTKIFMTKRSGRGKSEPIELPGDLMKAVDGAYSLKIGDDWLAAHDIRPGDILSFTQVKGERRSPAAVVPINSRGPGLEDTRALPPGDTIGTVPDARALFRRLEDPRPAAVRPDAMAANLTGDRVSLFNLDADAVEPRATIDVWNLRTNSHESTTVLDDGSFCAGTAAEHGDPIMVRIVDHSHKLGDPLHERRLTFTAGCDRTPILSENPALLAEGPPHLTMDQLRLSDCGQRLVAEGGVTEGTVVSIYLASDPQKRATAIANAQGALDIPLPFLAHENDVLVVEGKNPFGLKDQATAWQKKAAFEARFELTRNAKLKLVSQSGAVFASGCNQTSFMNVDRVDNADPVRTIRAKIEQCGLRFSTYDWNTGNSAQLHAQTNWSQDAVATFNFDQGAGEVVVRVGAREGGGWREPELGPSQGTRTYFGEIGSHGWSDNNREINVFRRHIICRDVKQPLPVRFEDAEGKIFARGQLDISVKSEWHSTGGSPMHPVWHADLDPSSLRECNG